MNKIDYVHICDDKRYERVSDYRPFVPSTKHEESHSSENHEVILFFSRTRQQ